MNAIDATLDPEVIILDPDGTQAVRDNDSGGNLNSLIAAYLVRAEGATAWLPADAALLRALRTGAGWHGGYPPIRAWTDRSRSIPRLASRRTDVLWVDRRSAVAVFYAFDGTADRRWTSPWCA
jgi:hypothetical protein